MTDPSDRNEVPEPLDERPAGEGTEPMEPAEETEPAPPEPDTPQRPGFGLHWLAARFLAPGCLFWAALHLLVLFLVAVLWWVFGWPWAPLWLFLLLLLGFLLLLWLWLGLFRLTQDVKGCTVTLSGPDCICEGERGVFVATGNPAGGSCAWSVGSDLRLVQSSACRATVRADDSGTTSTVEVEYTVGDAVCTATKTVKLPAVDEIVGRDCVCIGELARFHARTDPRGCEGLLRWRADGATGTGRTFSTRFRSAGTHTITVSCGISEETFDVDVASLESIEPDVAYIVPSGDVTLRRAGGAWVADVPDAVVEFTTDSDPSDCGEIRWRVTGPSARPVGGSGRRFKVTFSAPGRYVIEAECGTQTRRRVVDFCDFKRVIDQAANYYGNSIDFSRVTIDFEGTVPDASWVFHDDVSIGDGVLDYWGGCPPARHYVHELGHVWEYQHGQLQITLGIVDQIGNFFTNVYNYGGAAGVRNAVANGRSLDSFNREQQAEIFADDFEAKRTGAVGAYAADLAALTGPALAAPPTN